MARKNKQAIAKEFGTFLRLYGRKAQKGCEPNDRGCDPEIERELRRMKPEELDRLINGDADERLPTKISKLPTSHRPSIWKFIMNGLFLPPRLWQN